MIFKAALSNKAHPEYGQISIPFPIPDSEYDRTIGLLESMGIGSPTAQDCQVDELDGFYPVLSCLAGQNVNVDELDYLAKRLDSFDGNEDNQFMAMACKLGLSDIRDFINLTFSCQQATVITSFFKLEQAGKAHSMNIRGGAMPTGEFNKLNGRAIALELLQSGAGVVTPYGVVFDNGMELKQLYNGRQFPPYCYAPAVLEAEVTAEGAMGFLNLPMPDGQLKRMLIRGGIQNLDLPLAITMDSLPDNTSDVLDLERLTVGDLPALNRLCRAVQPMDEAEMRKLDAVVVQTGASDIDSVCRLAGNLDQFDITPGAEGLERDALPGQHQGGQEMGGLA